MKTYSISRAIIGALSVIITLIGRGDMHAQQARSANVEKQPASVTTYMRRGAVHPVKKPYNLAEYAAWKKDMKALWREKGSKPIEQLIGLIELVDFHVKKLEESPQFNFLTKRHIKQTLFGYNFLREEVDKNLTLARTFDEIDFEWLDDIRQMHEAYRTVAKDKEEGFVLPTVTEQELILEAQKVAGIMDKLAAFSAQGGGLCDIGLIAVGQRHDLDDILSVIYHELGHIKHKDNERDKRIRRAQSLKQHDKKNNKHDLFINFIESDEEYKADMQRINRYIELAQQKIDASSETGQKILEELAKTKTFWNPPEDPKKKAEIALGRWEESMADLFAYNEFFKQNRLDPVLYTIKKYGTSGYNTVEDEEDHPSGLEIALYTAGFLIDKGIDINKALRDWENRGTCKDVTKLYGPWSRLHKKEVSALEQEYMKLIKENEALDYELFKKDFLERIKAQHDGKERLETLLDNVLDNVSYYREENPKAKKYALYAYNVLREVLGKSIANDSHEIDLQWLERGVEEDIVKKQNAAEPPVKKQNKDRLIPARKPERR